VIAGVASAHATNEELFVFRRFLDALGVQATCVAVERGRSDALLIKEEKGANATGARAIGFGPPDTVMDRIRSGAIDAVIVMGHDVLHPQLLGDVAALESADTVILLDSHVSELSRVAHAVFPTRVAAEKHGTLTNHAGHVQRVRPAVEPAWEAYSEGEIIARLGAALDLDGFDGRFDVREVGKALSAAVPAFEGVDLESVGATGRALATAGESD
jgi:predicted molibdopterin-dependent oxidoreductase YjgC